MSTNLKLQADQIFNTSFDTVMDRVLDANDKERQSRSWLGVQFHELRRMVIEDLEREMRK